MCLIVSDNLTLRSHCAAFFCSERNGQGWLTTEYTTKTALSPTKMWNIKTFVAFNLSRTPPTSCYLPLTVWKGIMTWRIATFEAHEWKGWMSREGKDKGTVGDIESNDGETDRLKESEIEADTSRRHTERLIWRDKCDGGRRRQGQAEKERQEWREWKRQKACLLILACLSLPTSHCALQQCVCDRVCVCVWTSKSNYILVRQLAI